VRIGRGSGVEELDTNGPFCSQVFFVLAKLDLRGAWQEKLGTLNKNSYDAVVEMVLHHSHGHLDDLLARLCFVALRASGSRWFATPSVPSL